jgi:hypothetical protein
VNTDRIGSLSSGLFSGCPNQEIGQIFLFEGHKIGTCCYFGADSATKITTVPVTRPFNRMATLFLDRVSHYNNYEEGNALLKPIKSGPLNVLAGPVNTLQL